MSRLDSVVLSSVFPSGHSSARLVRTGNVLILHFSRLHKLICVCMCAFVPHICARVFVAHQTLASRSPHSANIHTRTHSQLPWQPGPSMKAVRRGGAWHHPEEQLLPCLCVFVHVKVMQFCVFFMHALALTHNETRGVGGRRH